ncbi:MAG TPA: glycosyltransferase family 2 protein [Nitrospiraceae bacterium]|jgi:glycosyltransferase involved in cell wall biosynthesis|nr:glycosyltransferase family 2 protein [Nitrospiraceae bacterium]
MISVVIPLFNKGSHIAKALQSVFAQSYQDFEVIIVNDGSTDRGPEIVRSVKDPRVTVIDQLNAGVSMARNRGIEAARGELLAFLDADDEWRPDFLATILRLHDRYPDAGLYASAYQILSRANKMTDPRFKALPSPPWEGIIPSYFRSAALGMPPVWTSASCAPLRVLVEVGGFKAGKRMGEDVDLWGRIAIRYPVAFSFQKGAVYCKNAENRACMVFRRQDEHPFLETVETWRGSENIPEKIKKDLELYICRLRLENVRQHVLAGNLERARELSALIRSKWTFPIRQLLWGSYLNSITRILWRLRYQLSHPGFSKYDREEPYQT